MTGATRGAGTATLTEHACSSPVFRGDRVIRSLVLCVIIVVRCLFALSFFFFWPLCCMSFLYLWIQMTPLGSSIASEICSHNVGENRNRFVEQLDHLKVNFDGIFLR